jgi:hypothetical protein
MKTMCGIHLEMRRKQSKAKQSKAKQKQSKAKQIRASTAAIPAGVPDDSGLEAREARVKSMPYMLTKVMK